MTTHSQQLASAAPALSPGTQVPMVYVVGSSRSGTTMMGNVLGLHSRIFMFKELHFFEKLWTEKDRNRELSTDAAIDLAAHLLCIQRDGILFQGDRRRYLEEARAIQARLSGRRADAATLFAEFLRHEAVVNGKSVGCDQTPRNVFYIKDILELYPKARVVVMVRDPRDVLLSQKKKWKMRFQGLNDDPYSEALRLKINYHPITTSLLWKAAVEAGHRWEGHARVRILRFEDLVADPERELKALCAFLQIPFESQILEIPQVNSSFTGTRSTKRGIDGSASGRWLTGGLSPTELHLCQKVTAEYMASYRYEPAAVAPGRIALPLSLATFPLKAALAVLFNLSKIRNLPEAVRRRFGGKARWAVA